MKRLFTLLCVLGAATVALSFPPVAEAAPPGCFCGGTQSTSQDWAQAATCDQAKANLWAQAYAQISCPESNGYGRCSLQHVLTADCHWDTYTGKWQVDGYVNYRCWVCLEP
jgi:hypothetical protein